MADNWFDKSLQDNDFSFVDVAINASCLGTSLMESLEEDVEELNLESSEKEELKFKTSYESMPSSSSFRETSEKLKMITENPRNYYYKYIKPNLDPDCSASDIFCEVYSWPEQIEPDVIDNFVQKRVDNIIASASRSIIPNAVEEKDNYIFPSDINTTKSNEMNHSNFKNDCETTFIKYENSIMKRSFSASCLPDSFGFNKNLDDEYFQQPTEFKKDEFGFPVIKFSAFNSPKKNNEADVTHVVNTYRKLRTSLCELQIETDDDHCANDETYSNPLTALKEPPLSSDNPDIHVKKNQPNVNKGPMRAVMPIQTMTKAGSVKVKSPVKLAKADSLSKILRRSLEEGSFHENLPIAASTPTGRSRRDSTANSSIRSLSEGAGTPKRNTEVNVSYTKNKNTLLNTTVTYSDQPKKTREPLQIKPTLKKFVGIRRPSSAPIKSSPSPNILSSEFRGNEPSIIYRGEKADFKSKASLTKRPSNIPFKPANSTLSTSKQNNDSKPKKTFSVSEKENKKYKV